MKKLLSTGILLSLCIQQFIIPMNIVNAAQVEQKTFVSLLGAQANYKNFFDKILGFDMTSQMSSRQENGSTNGATIRESGRYVSINDINQAIKSGTLDANGVPSDIDMVEATKINRSVSVTRNYSYRESIGIPGLSDNQKFNEEDTITTSARSFSNTGLGRVWISSGSSVYIGGDGNLGQSSKWTIFYQWGKPIDHNITQAAHNEMQRYSMGWRDLPLAPIVPGYNGTPMAFLNDEVNRQRDEQFLMRDGKEIPDSQAPFDKIASIDSFASLGTSRQSIPNQEFFTSNRPYFGQLCGYNEGPCGGVSVKMWETTRRTRAFPGVGSIVFKSDRSGYLYYDATFKPKSDKYKTPDLNFNITTSTSDLKAALKSVVWDSRGDPCETPDVTTDPVCKAAYGQTTTVNTPLSITLSSDTSFSTTRNYLASPGDILSIPLQTGGAVTLTWGSQGATLCTLNNQDIGLSGIRAFSGLVNDGIVYHFKCINSSTNKSASLYFRVIAPTVSGIISGGTNTIIEESTTNPYSSYISSTNRQKLTKWVFNLMVKGSSLGIDKYSKVVEANIARLRTIVRTTKNANTSIMAKYLIFELQQIQDKLEEDSLFLDGIFN